LEPASLDLIEIIEFVSRDRPAAARTLGREILQAGKRLGRNPRRGRLVPELQDQGISECRQIFVGVYRLIYDIQPESIDILALLDGRRDARTILFQRLIR
jgi:toxin ParE1/3/4